MGCKVRRNPQFWKWGNQDGGGNGVVTSIDITSGWVVIQWDHNGSIDKYRWGAEQAYDIEPVAAVLTVRGEIHLPGIEGLILDNKSRNILRDRATHDLSLSYERPYSTIEIEFIKIDQNNILVGYTIDPKTNDDAYHIEARGKSLIDRRELRLRSFIIELVEHGDSPYVVDEFDCIWNRCWCEAQRAARVVSSAKQTPTTVAAIPSPQPNFEQPHYIPDYEVFNTVRTPSPVRSISPKRVALLPPPPQALVVDLPKVSVVGTRESIPVEVFCGSKILKITLSGNLFELPITSIKATLQPYTGFHGPFNLLLDDKLLHDSDTVAESGIMPGAQLHVQIPQSATVEVMGVESVSLPVPVPVPVPVSVPVSVHPIQIYQPALPPASVVTAPPPLVIPANSPDQISSFSATPVTDYSPALISEKQFPSANASATAAAVAAAHRASTPPPRVTSPYQRSTRSEYVQQHQQRMGNPEEAHPRMMSLFT